MIRNNLIVTNSFLYKTVIVAGLKNFILESKIYVEELVQGIIFNWEAERETAEKEVDMERQYELAIIEAAGKKVKIKRQHELEMKKLEIEEFEK